MKSNYLIATLVALVAATTYAQIPADAAAAMAQAMAAFGQVANQNAATATAAGGSIDAKEMRALLPEKDAVAGYKRVKAATESNAMLGVKMTTATAEFEAHNGKASFEIKYMDIAGLSGFARMALAIQEIDEETENGFKRTVTYPGGFKAMEEYDDGDTEIKTFAGDQIVVEFKARGLKFEDAKKLFEVIDLKKLAALKPAPAAAE